MCSLIQAEHKEKLKVSGMYKVSVATFDFDATAVIF